MLPRYHPCFGRSAAALLRENNASHAPGIGRSSAGEPNEEDIRGGFQPVDRRSLWRFPRYFPASKLFDKG